MKKTLTLSIPKPCHENWDEMTPVEKGRFCSSCNKTVLDFTSKSDEQIIETMESKGKICGRFNKTQLDRKLALQRKEQNSFRTLLASGFFSFLTLGYYQEAKAQGEPRTLQTDSTSVNDSMVKGKPAVSILDSLTVNGTILDENGLPLPGTNVVVKGTQIGTQTDFDGNFEIKAKKGQKLLISYLGYKAKEIKIENSDSIKIKMTYEDLDMLGEVVVVTGGIVAYCEPEQTPEEKAEQKRKNKLRKNNYFTFYKRKSKEEKEAKKKERDSIEKGKK